jgi:predicted ATPase
MFKIIALYRYTTAENILITLDEPDINLHPEWSRRFIDIIYKFF